MLASMAWESYLNIWNLIPGCLMWITWLERNRHYFEDTKKTLEELKVLYQRSPFEWSRCWSFTNCSSLSEFMFSLRLVSKFPSLFFFFFGNLFYPFLVVHHHEQLVFFLTIFFNNIFLITYQKKKF